jgi:hypothetical protein
MILQILKSILFIFVVISICGCKSESNEFFDPSVWSGPYQGITFTDLSGYTLRIDPDDWCVEVATPTIDTSGLMPIQPMNVGPYAFLPAYPNPVDSKDGIILIVFYTAQSSRVKIFIDDSNFQTVKIIADRIFNKGLYHIQWDLKNYFDYKVPGGIYRCYMFADDFSCYGDIWVK